jgi:hypothetical protein
LICSNCYDNSRREKNRRQHARRRFPASVGEHNDPRPPELRAVPESAPSLTVIEGGVLLVPLKDDEPSAA